MRLLPQIIFNLADRLSDHGHSLFVVGGAVRDFLMDNDPDDFDLCTDATPTQLHAILSDKKLIDVGEAFGVTIFHDDEIGDVEIATLRKDMTPGRHPDVKFTDSVHVDAKRRDLTVNAIFFDVGSRSIVDPVGGIDDIKRQVIRTVGKPQDRFEEDPLRKLRAIRFAHRLGFDMHHDVAEALRSDTTLDGVSSERVRMEFIKGMRQAICSADFIGDLIDFGFIHHCFGDLAVARPVPCRDHIVQASIMLRDNDPSDVERVLKSLSWTSRESFQVRMLVQLSGGVEDADVFFSLFNALQRDRLHARRVLSVGSFLEMNDVCTALVNHDKTVDAQDVMDEGFEGPEIGQQIRSREFAAFQKSF